ncbi:MAG: hypothetical protein ACKVVP_15810 [Chloroflexota bacterium]
MTVPRMRLTGRVGWLARFILITVVLVEIPYIIAFSQIGQGWVFAGMIWSPHDFAQYASAMRQGAASSDWLIYDRLSHEPHDPAFISVFYVALGKLAALTGLEFSLAFHAAEIACRVMLLLALYHVTSLLYQEPRRRRLALALIAFTSGFGALMLVIGISLRLPLEWSIFTAEDLSVPELNTFLVLFTAPHLMLGLAAIMVWAVGYCRALCQTGVRWLGLIGLATIIVGLTNPFSLVSMLCIAFAHTGLGWIVSRRITWSSVITLSAVALSAGPFLAYNVLVFGRDPFWGATYGAQNALISAPPVELALSYGGLLILTVIGAQLLLRDRSEGARLIVVWIVLITLLMYAPVSFQRRFGFGLQPILALAASFGLQLVIARIWAATGGVLTWRWRFVRSSTVLALTGTTFTVYVLMFRAAAIPVEGTHVSSAFHPLSVRDAASWLAPRTQSTDLVLAETHTSNYLSGWLPGRVYSAHWVATADFREKSDMTRWFYSTRDDAARHDFLEQLGARYVVYGPRERALGGAPLNQLNLRPVYESPEMTVYERAGELQARAQK